MIKIKFYWNKTLSFVSKQIEIGLIECEIKRDNLHHIIKIKLNYKVIVHKMY